MSLFKKNTQKQIESFNEDQNLSIKDRFLLITLPDTGHRIAKMTENKGIKTLSAQTMKEAVQLAQQYTTKGGKVILSPAAPSYNLYKNFEERGQDFLNCIQMKD